MTCGSYTLKGPSQKGENFVVTDVRFPQTASGRREEKRQGCVTGEKKPKIKKCQNEG